MKHLAVFLLACLVALPAGAGNPFNPSGTFSQSYGVIVDPATGNPVGVSGGRLQTSASNAPVINGSYSPARPSYSLGGLVNVDGAGRVFQSPYVERILDEQYATLDAYWQLTDNQSATTLVDSSSAGITLTTSGTTFHYAQPGLMPGGGLGIVSPASSPSFTPLWQGDPRQSGFFTSTSGAAAAASGTPLSFEYNQQFTIAFTVKPQVDRSGGAHDYVVLSKRLGGTTFQGYEVELKWTSTKTIVVVNLNNSTSLFNQVQTTTDLSNTQPWHVVVTYNGNPSDSTGGLQVYINGTAETLTISSKTLSTNSMVSSAPFTLGTEAVSNGNQLQSNLQDVAVFAGLLPQQEIQYLASLFLGRTQVGSVASTVTPVCNPLLAKKVILDNDMASDIGNTMLFAAAFALEKAGCINILAITVEDLGTQTSPAGYSAGVVQALLAYENVTYGIPIVPIGAVQSPTSTVTLDQIHSQTVCNNWYTGVFLNGGTCPYNLAYYSTRGLTPTPVLRQALASSGGGVYILAAGPLTNLSGLLNSSADSISPLSGSALISANVVGTIISAGCYPSPAAAQANGCPNTSAEFNMSADAPASNNVFANWPTQIIVPGIELAGVVTGGTGVFSSPMLSQSTWVNQTGSMYQWMFDQGSVPLSNGQRPIWDALPAIFVGSNGVGPLFDYAGMGGTNTVNSSTGANAWSMTGRNTTYLRFRQSNAFMANLVSSIMNNR